MAWMIIRHLTLATVDLLTLATVDLLGVAPENERRLPRRVCYPQGITPFRLRSRRRERSMSS
jgi:hypothetical protein